MTQKQTDKQIKLTLIRSAAGRLKSHRACARGLGLHRTHSTSVVVDTPENRGMIRKIAYLLQIEEVS